METRKLVETFPYGLEGPRMRDWEHIAHKQDVSGCLGNDSEH